MKTKIAQQEKGIGIPRRGVANTGQPCTYQKPQLIKSPGVIHALGKAEIPGEEVELNPASPWWARKESLTGLCRQEGFRKMETGYREPQER